MSKKKEINRQEQYFCGYKFRIYPTKEQILFIEKCFDIDVYVYNWAIEQEEKQYQMYKDGKISIEESFIGFYQLCLMFKEYRNNSWLMEYPLGFMRESLQNAIQSFRYFFNGLCNRPHFKSRKAFTRSYHTRIDKTHIRGNRLRIEGLRYTSNIDYDTIEIDKDVLKYNFDNVKFVDPTISRDNIGNYYFSFCILKDKPLDYFETNNIPKSKAIGVCVNTDRDNRVVCSDGTIFKAPNISKYEKKIKRLSRKVSKDKRIQRNLERTGKATEPSKRSEKRLYQLRKYYKKVVNKNNTYYSTIVKQIVDKRPEAVIVGTAKIRDLMEDHDISVRKIQFDPVYLFRNKMAKKCNMYNIPFYFKQLSNTSDDSLNKLVLSESDALNLERLAYNYDFTNMSNIDLANIN